MSTKKKAKGRFAGIPFSIIQSTQWANLNGREVKLLVDLLEQYTGRNNGNLSPSHALMAKRGWPSTSLWRAKKGLIEKGFIVVTRQGCKQRGKATLVAITWNGIDEPRYPTVYDEGIKPHPVPLNLWKRGKIN